MTSFLLLVAAVATGPAATASTSVVRLPRDAGLSITGVNPDQGLSPGDGVGEEVAWLGDVNGDGREDIAVASCGYNLGGDPGPDYGNDDSGAAWVIFGSRQRDWVDLNDVDGRGFLIRGGFVSPMYQSCHVARAGDVNGDGLDDVLFGAPGASNNSRRDSGSVYVVFGKADEGRVDLADFDRATQGGAGFRVDGAAAGDLAGFAIDGLGDLNSDSRDDFVVGAPFASATYVVFGRGGSEPLDLGTLGTALVNPNGYPVHHPAPADVWTYDVAGTGDVNGDGVPDLVVGLKEDAGEAGDVWVVPGHPAPVADDVGSAAFEGFHVYSSQPHSDIGVAVDGAGDVNGDGYADLVLGVANTAAGGHYPRARGSAYVVFGSASRVEVDVRDLGRRGYAIVGTKGMHLGSVVAGVGDVNSDGRDDVAAVGSAESSAVVYVVNGKSSKRTLFVEDLGRRGFSVRFRPGASPVDGGGDVNGDGRADIVVGSSLAADGRGRAFVVWAKP